MKTKQLSWLMLLLSIAFCHLQAQEIDNQELAKKVLKNTFNVQPGNVVVINGGKHTLDLLEAFVIEAEKMGAVVTSTITTDRIARSFVNDVHAEYYGLSNDYLLSWIKLVDVWINLPALMDPKGVYGDVTEEKFAKLNKANQAVYESYNNMKIVGGFVNYPTESAAKNAEIDFESYKKMQWKAINADYTQISAKARTLKEMLTNSNEIEITSKAGTNITFSVKGRDCYLFDGVIDADEKNSQILLKKWVNFPEGSVSVSVIEDSGNGTVKIPKFKWSFEEIRDISFTVSNGKLNQFDAKKGKDAFLATWEQYASPHDMIGGFQIGLNPELKVMEEGNAEYRPEHAEGMVYLMFGSNNFLGGKNSIEGEVSYSFPITNATVKIDGKIVISDGKLVLNKNL